NFKSNYILKFGAVHDNKRRRKSNPFYSSTLNSIHTPPECFFEQQIIFSPFRMIWSFASLFYELLTGNHPFKNILTYTFMNRSKLMKKQFEIERTNSIQNIFPLNKEII